MKKSFHNYFHQRFQAILKFGFDLKTYTFNNKNIGKILFCVTAMMSTHSVDIQYTYLLKCNYIQKKALLTLFLVRLQLVLSIMLEKKF